MWQLSYSADGGKTRQVLTEAVIKSVDNHGSELPPEVYLVELGSSSVDWSLRVWGCAAALLGSP